MFHSFIRDYSTNSPLKFIWVAIFIFAALVLWFTLRLYQARRKFRVLKDLGIPLMKHSFILGHLLVVRQFYLDWPSDANFIQTFSFYISKHWKIFFPDEDRCPPVVYVDVWPFSNPMAFSMEAYVSNQIQMGKNLLAKSPMEEEYLKPITNRKGLNSMLGEEWRTWRSRFNPGFSQNNIRAWIPAILVEIEAFTIALQGLAGENSNWGRVFQLEQISSNLALDATARVVFGTRLNSHSSSPSPFTIAFREQLGRMELTLNIFKLLWRATPIFSVVVMRTRRQLFKFIRPFIVESFGELKPGPRTIVQSAVEEVNRETTDKGKNIAHTLDESFIEYVFSHLMVFIFAGDDPVSITVPKIFRLLQLHPECLEKLREEHDLVIGPDLDTAADKIQESPDILDSLPYTLGVIKETLRLYPTTITIRQGQPDFAFYIQGSDIAWPTQGFDLFDSSITIHRDPSNFPNPLDFIPERFLVPEEDPLYPPKNVWRAFQLGPRTCIGQELAIVQLKLVLVLVARKFDIEMAWSEWDSIREQQGFKVKKQTVEGDRMYITGTTTPRSKDGAPVHVRLRN